MQESTKRSSCFRVWTLQPLEYVPREYLIYTIANILYQELWEKAIDFRKGGRNRKCSLDTSFQVL